jgi:hypothetical protein
MSRFSKIIRKTGCAAAVPAYLLLCAWCAMVVYYHSAFFPKFCAWGFWLASAAVFISAVFVKRNRPATFIIAAIMPLTVTIWWFTITPANNADWQTPWARMPEIEVKGNVLSIQNIRDFNYRGENDYDVRYISGDYDLEKLEKVMLVLSYWDGNTAVAHTMLDFGFKDGKWLVISSETRLKNGQQQTALGGLFKQYGSLYIIGTEADLLMLRTNYRKEQVYMYQMLRITPAESRTLLLDLVKRCNQLRTRPMFYNTITGNCMTSLIPSMRTASRDPNVFRDIRILLNGYSDEMIYERNYNPAEISYEQFRQDHYITTRMQRVTDRAQYSAELHNPLKP